MKKILITGGTTFVSKYTANYFVQKGYDVYVLNRNNREQVEGVKLIEADRANLGDTLKGLKFDVIADITAYNKADISNLLASGVIYDTYIFISSSAVYPETENQPFKEDVACGPNTIWGKYGTDKIEAENALLECNKDAYILRPPYLYGPMNNLYREAFVFDCAMADRRFFVPGNGDMKLQFFHVKDLCRIMEVIIDKKPEDHIINVGNPEAVTIKEWVSLCYNCLEKKPEFVNVYKDVEQRKYFSFYNYDYCLDTTIQSKLLPEVTPLADGLVEAYSWYKDNRDQVIVKPLIEYIDSNLDEYNNSVDFWNTALYIPEEEKEALLQEEVGEDDWKQFAPSEKQFIALSSFGDCERVLDYGCGDGWASMIIANCGSKRVHSVDVIPNGIEATRLYAKLLGVESIVEAECISTDWISKVDADSYDGAYCSNVIDVVPPEIALDIIKGLAKAVKKGGKVVISMNYYEEPTSRPERQEFIKNDNQLFVNGILRLVLRTDDEWINIFKPYFELEKLEHFAWPQDTEERRRLFYLKSIF